jgi:hypothetical protein
MMLRIGIKLIEVSGEQPGDRKARIFHDLKKLVQESMDA